MGAKIRAKGSREGAKKAIREADRALKRARSIVEHGPNPTGQEAS